MKIVKIMAVSAILAGAGYVTSTFNSNYAQAAAKTTHAKVLNYKTMRTAQVHFTKGTLYSSAKLSKVSAYAKNYKHETFYTSKQAKVMQKNGKVAIYQKVTNKSGNVKGWIWHGYAKKGAAPVAKTTSKTKVTAPTTTDTGSGVPIYSIGKMPKDYDTQAQAYVKKHGYLKGHANLKLKSRVLHASMKHSDAYGILKNGHRLYFKTTSGSGIGKNVIETMPGIHSKSDTSAFVNNSSHWKMYFVSGHGVKAHGEFDGNNGNIASPIPGFKYLPQKGESISNLPDVGEAAISGDAFQTLYNAKTKVLINFYQMNKAYGID